ncbi:hypothetical protein [Iodobacter fluviatilis]|nr:hypothetical protein C1H71_20040 [Iodobacter fluviatilis]
MSEAGILNITMYLAAEYIMCHSFTFMSRSGGV